MGGRAILQPSILEAADRVRPAPSVRPSVGRSCPMSSFFLPFAWAQSAATTFGGDVTLDFEAAVPESTSKAYEGMIMSIGDQYIPIS